MDDPTIMPMPWPSAWGDSVIRIETAESTRS
jgi:hypothetical protein